jgi:hypothetical protein
MTFVNDMVLQSLEFEESKTCSLLDFQQFDQISTKDGDV